MQFTIVLGGADTGVSCGRNRRTTPGTNRGKNKATKWPEFLLESQSFELWPVAWRVSPQSAYP
jgi:hypothetical protein